MYVYTTRVIVAITTENRRARIPTIVYMIILVTRAVNSSKDPIALVLLI